MKNTKLLCVLLVLSVNALARAAEPGAQTISAERIAQAKRLIPLERVTVGPDDQYSATLDLKNQIIAYTHKQSLLTTVMVQDLKTGDAVDLLPAKYDSQEPQFGPNGRLAFTYFKASARGDICYLKPMLPVQAAADADVKCLKRSKELSSSQRSNPFWKSDHELGFLERDFTSRVNRILVENIETGQQDVLAVGAVWAPTMQPGGHLLAFNELVPAETAHGNDGRRLAIKNLESQKTYYASIELPGLSGFPVLSQDERYVYFSHFMNDTNADHAIDGNDNGVLFRLPIDQFISSQGKPTFPEQLTSSETSCSYPRPAGDSLYATCAFEGSLDIYKLPSSGILPVSWDEKLIRAAEQTSRTYEERIFLINSLRSHVKTLSSFDSELFFDHLESGDAVAAEFYLHRMMAHQKPADKSFLQLLQIYIEGRELNSAEPTGEVSREFREKILKLDEQAEKIGHQNSAERSMTAIVRGILKTYIKEVVSAEQLLKKADHSISSKSSSVRPLERYFAFQLASRVYRRRLPELMSAYQKIIKAPELNEESQLYYAFSMLRDLRLVEPDKGKRIAWIERLNLGLPKAAATLLSSESVSLRLTEATDDKAKMSIYGELDKLMSETRSDYFLRKALYVRAILNFSEAADFKYLTLVATAWLKYTQKNETEFIYAREVFTQANFDQAYENLGQKKLELAGNYFYQVVSLVDDLEAHYGYVEAMNSRGQRKTINDRYDNLKNRNFISDNIKFVEALLVLIDSRDNAQSDPTDTTELDSALAKISTMVQDRDSAARYLLYGDLEMEKLLRKARGPAFDNELFQKANRHLLLAYDLAQDNVRIKVSSLMDLGLLHSRVQNYGLAARYFALRKSYPFETAEAQSAFAWYYGRALEHTGQPSQALAELSAVVPTRAPLLEHEAYDAALKGDYKLANQIYQKLFSTSGIGKADAESTAKTALMYGYSLLMADNFAEAHQWFQKSIQVTQNLKTRKASHDEFLDFDPKRLLVVSYGLLAQSIPNDHRAVIEALENRAKLLESDPGLVDDPEPKSILVNLQLADLYSSENASENAAEKMKAALKISIKHLKANGPLSLALFRSAVGQLVFSLGHDAYAQDNRNEISSLVNSCIKAYDTQKLPQPQLQYQSLKLKMLENAGRVDELMKSEVAESVRKQLPAQWKDLESLAHLLHPSTHSSKL